MDQNFQGHVGPHVFVHLFYFVPYQAVNTVNRVIESLNRFPPEPAKSNDSGIVALDQ
jgi:hypothetical protein